MEVNKILQGNTLTVLKTLPAESVNCVVTSPPYWGLRDYGVKGQLGLEKTFEEYIDKLCDIFDEIKRVLRKDGTCWVNLGDSYGGFQGKNAGYPDSKTKADVPQQLKPKHLAKSLMLIPQRFAIEMVNRGWILRNTIIWHKPNCMPSSAKDRFTVDFEYVYFFTKSNKAQFWTNSKTGDCVRKQPQGTKGIEGVDWEWQKKESGWQRPCRDETFKLPSRKKSTYAKEGYKKVSLWTGHDYWFKQQFDNFQSNEYDRNRMANARTEYGGKWAQDSGGSIKTQRAFVAGGSKGRNKRAVWTIPTKPFPEAHFAVYPEKLVEPMIKAGCPRYVCKKCGKARVKILKSKLKNNIYKPRENEKYSAGSEFMSDKTRLRCETEIIDKGYTDCGCNASFEGGIVLDPFMGAGTTAVVAKKQGKNYIGIELKQDYINMANKRIRAIPELLFI